MDQFKQQMDQQMQQLRDSLSQLQKEMNNADWSTFDTSDWQAPEMPEMPETPEAPDLGYSETFPGGEVYTNNDDTTDVRWGKWHVNVRETDKGKDQVQIFKDENCDGCDDDNHWDN